jgi:hypothetical protein
VLAHGRDELQLAAAARARGGPRLRRVARGLPPACTWTTPRASGALLAEHRPAYRGPQRWLRANGAALVL